MPRKKLAPADQMAREAETLNKPINPTGEGEDEAIKALLSPDFERMSNLDASEVALLLQQIVRGQNSLMEQNSIQIAQIRERQDQIDKRLSDELESNRKFIEEVLDRAESLKRTGLENDKLIANGVAQYEQAKQKAVAKRAVKNIQFHDQIRKEPKVMVISPGQLITTMEHGQQVARIIPEEIRIADMRWVLPPGVPIEVPQTVAGIMDQRRASQIETFKRQEMLSKHMEATELAKEWAKVEGSKTEPMPIG